MTLYASLQDEFESGGVVPQEIQDNFVNLARRQDVRAGTLILSKGDPGQTVLLLLSGTLKISLLSKSGKETVLREIGPGRFVGELSALDHFPRSVDVTALSDCSLAIMNGEAFCAFLSETSKASIWLCRQMAIRIRDLTQKTFDLATQSISSRVQGELLRLCAASQSDEDSVFLENLPTHSVFAARLGTHREAITKELRLLTAEGIIEQTGRKMRIISRSRLRELYLRTSQ